MVLARAVADVDRISGGRAVLGLGSGDMPDEFRRLGLAYPPARERRAALEEALRIIRPLLRGEVATVEGVHFRADEAVLQPPPAQRPSVPLLVAGGGERTTLRLAARYADASNLGAASWAGGAFTADDARRKLAVLDRHCEETGRPPAAVLRTAYVHLFLAASPAAARAKLERLPSWLRAFFQRLPVVGTPEDAIEPLRGLVAAGFQFVIVGGGADLETLRLTAERVIPAVAGR